MLEIHIFIQMKTYRRFYFGDIRTYVDYSILTGDAIKFISFGKERPVETWLSSDFNSLEKILSKTLDPDPYLPIFEEVNVREGFIYTNEDLYE